MRQPTFIILSLRLLLKNDINPIPRVDELEEPLDRLGGFGQQSIVGLLGADNRPALNFCDKDREVLEDLSEGNSWAVPLSLLSEDG